MREVNQTALTFGNAELSAQRPLRILGLLAAISIASFLFGAVLPGVVAWRSKVFFQSGIESKLPDKAKESIQAFSSQIESAKET